MINEEATQLRCCFCRILLLCVFSFYWRAAVADPRTTVVGQYCIDANATSGPTLANNFVPAMDTLYSNVSANQYGTAIAGQGPNAVYGLGQCYGDLSPVDCKLCFLEVRSILPKCYPKIGGRLYLEGCFGRYGNYSFFTVATDSQDAKVCSQSNSSSSSPSFSGAVRNVISNVTSEALQNQGYAVNSATVGSATAYALAQCWVALNNSQCSSCLNAAASSVMDCLPSEDGQALFSGCYLRYSSGLFWNANSGGANSGGSGSVLWILGPCVGVVLIAIGIFLWRKRIFGSKGTAESLLDLYGDEIPVRIQQSSLNFKYRELRKATNNFNDSNNLGQGSYGAVYKAVLADGKQVAVKRLFLNTRQWIDQFFNEVDLISQVRHKNLVKLFGCSVDGPESLLVYEYYPNKSLDLFLFSEDDSKHLTWQQRVEIIQGVAEGLSYLHEESDNRIIHRDIKASNILLDENLKPKITDFGLARALTDDKTHLTTGVAGTLGYMAPEYIVHGHLTEKADVYSYGILVLEIVTGRRCGSSTGAYEGQLLLSKVVRHYKANTIEDIIDKRTYKESLREEFIRMVHIGLLCTQAAGGDRPTMSKVVELLRSQHSHELELLLADPPFMDVEGVEQLMPAGENSRLLHSDHSVPPLSTSSFSYFSGR